MSEWYTKSRLFFPHNKTPFVITTFVADEYIVDNAPCVIINFAGSKNLTFYIKDESKQYGIPARKVTIEQYIEEIKRIDYEQDFENLIK